ncbi:hypothetical protein GCM10022215_18220 [Nocardioides fonticola]|uniref:Uncharacterized protein n=1 Tax=Nocardioides fonticola TaxID=450363 RepID=A0ABP7XJ93_9ACTN
MTDPTPDPDRASVLLAAMEDAVGPLPIRAMEWATKHLERTAGFDLDETDDPRFDPLIEALTEAAELIRDLVRAHLATITPTGDGR